MSQFFFPSWKFAAPLFHGPTYLFTGININTMSHERAVIPLKKPLLWTKSFLPNFTLFCFSKAPFLTWFIFLWSLKWGKEPTHSSSLRESYYILWLKILFSTYSNILGFFFLNLHCCFSFSLKWESIKQRVTCLSHISLSLGIFKVTFNTLV